MLIGIERIRQKETERHNVIMSRWLARTDIERKRKRHIQ